jgi:hypothetical protein
VAVAAVAELEATAACAAATAPSSASTDWTASVRAARTCASAGLPALPESDAAAPDVLVDDDPHPVKSPSPMTSCDARMMRRRIS